MIDLTKWYKKKKYVQNIEYENVQDITKQFRNNSVHNALDSHMLTWCNA